MEKWETDSLRWLHRIREENFERTKGKPLKKVIAESRKAAMELSKAFNLKIVGKPEKTYSRS